MNRTAFNAYWSGSAVASVARSPSVTIALTGKFVVKTAAGKVVAECETYEQAMQIAKLSKQTLTIPGIGGNIHT